MFSTPAKPVAHVVSETERIALIDQLCASLGTQYKDMKKYRGL